MAAAPPTGVPVDAELAQQAVEPPTLSSSVISTSSARSAEDEEKVLSSPAQERDEKEVVPEKPAGPPAPPPAAEKLPLAAYLTVIGGFCCLFTSFGLLSAFGVWQAVYVRRYNVSDSTASWCGSVQQCIMLASNLIAGPLLDQIGPRPLLLTYAILLSFSCMMISLTTAFWQVLLAQAIVQGIALSISFGPPMTATILWFKARSPPAVAVVVAGSSCGGIVWPILINNLLPKIGFAWTWRVIGFMCLAIGLTATALVTVPYPPAYQRRRAAQRAEKARLAGGEGADTKPIEIPRQPFFYPEVFRHPPYVLLVFAFFFLFLGLMAPLFLLPTLGLARGMTQNLAFYSLACVNAASFFGRLLLPFPALRVGAFNILIPSVAITGVIALCFMATHSVAGVLVVGCLYGFWSGGAISLQATATALCVPDKRRLGAAIGQGFALSSISVLLGPPIAGWILATPAGFKAVFGFCGGMIFLGSAFMLASRLAQERRIFVAI